MDIIYIYVYTCIHGVVQLHYDADKCFYNDTLAL